MRYFFFSILYVSLFGNVYNDAIEEIEKIYASSISHSHSDFLNLDIVKSNSKLKLFLKEIVENNGGVLSQISGYYHPVGFIKIILYKGKKGQQLRLHLWGEGEEKAIHQDFNEGWEPIHNHRWNFSSKVLKGGLDCREFMTKDNSKRHFQPYKLMTMPTRQKENDYQMIDMGKFVMLAQSLEKYVLEGQSYYLDHATPHQIKSEPKTSTLLLMDPPSKLTASEIFLSENEHPQLHFELSDLTDEEIRKYIDKMIQELATD
jgi:hypothetical protein